MPVINGDNTTSQSITGSGQIWTVTEDATVLAPTNYALYEAAGLHDNTINVLGILRVDPQAGNTALLSEGDNTVVKIGANGFLSGFNGINCSGAGADITNAGTISASATGANGVGIRVATTVAEITNSGLISANIGVSYMGNSSFTNAEGGTIIGYNVPIQNFSVGGLTDSIINHGTITKVGGGTAINTVGGDETVRNDGLIDGDLRLGPGKDVFDNRGGELRGFFYGQLGDDTLITDKAIDKLSEAFDEGDDTVKSSVSYELSINVEALVLTGKKNLKGTGSIDDNDITGNSGNNTLMGLAGEDTLDGGKGKDKLTGGAEADEFVFHRKGGVDTITDYVDEEDSIAILGFGNIDSFQKLSHRIDQHGDDVWITLGGGDKLILKDIDRGALEATDFDFAS